MRLAWRLRDGNIFDLAFSAGRHQLPGLGKRKKDGVILSSAINCL